MVEIEDVASSQYQMYILDKAGSLFEILPIVDINRNGIKTS